MSCDKSPYVSRFGHITHIRPNGVTGSDLLLLLEKEIRIEPYFRETLFWGIEMKLDYRTELSTSQKRTTKLIVGTFFLLLSKKSFEDITVREICRASLIPHSTFYNYFDDKYDVFRWAFYKTFYEYYPEMDLVMNHYDNIDLAAERVCDFMDQHKGMLRKVAAHNPPNGALYQLLKEVATEIGQILAGNCTRDKNFDFPYEVLFGTYINGFLEMFHQTFYQGKTYSREQIRNYMRDLYDV